MPVTTEDIEKLSDADRDALVSIYWHRCLNEDLLYKHHYRKESLHRSHAVKGVARLIELGFVEAVEYGAEQPALFLTGSGVIAVRRILVYPERWNFTAGELKMQTFLINHQMALNAAALDMEDEAKEKGIPHEYLDCKFMDYNGNVMPDGMIRFGNCDVFLEMDLNHEQQDELVKKWDHYRAWLESGDYLSKDRKTIVLFLLGNVVRVQLKRAGVLRSLGAGLLDKMSPMFDVYIDTPEALQRLLFDEILHIPQHIGELQRVLANHGMTLALAENFNNLAFGSYYGFYARMLSPANHGIVVKDGRAQEFLVDIGASGLPASAFAKTMMHNRTSQVIEQKIGRRIPYLIVGDSEKEICRGLMATGAAGVDGTYFTTLERLENSPTLPQAICSLDALKRMYCYMDYGLAKPMYVQSM